MSKLKHSYGQYFTQEELTDEIVSKSLEYTDNLNSILEPSYGNGQFIKSLLKVNPHFNIDAYEVDGEIYKPIQNANCVLGDFLFSEMDKKYPLIIGNPPYIELTYSFYTDQQRDQFKSIYTKKGRGRINLVHAFFDRSFDLLEDGGVLSFLIPSSFLSSPWYNDIRERIYNEYTIKELIDDVDFKGVSMQVSLIILKKVKSDKHEHIIKKGDFYQITNKITNKNGGKTIKELGFNVGVGHYCWSHYRESLNNDEVGRRLLYSSYLVDDQVIDINNRNQEKKKFLGIENSTLISNAIVFPRTSSKKVRFSLLLDNQYLFENHIIYITNDDVSKLVELYDHLSDNKHLIVELLNSTNLTKSEIENISIEFKKGIVY